MSSVDSAQAKPAQTWSSEENTLDSDCTPATCQPPSTQATHDNAENASDQKPNAASLEDSRQAGAEGDGATSTLVKSSSGTMNTDPTRIKGFAGTSAGESVSADAHGSQSHSNFPSSTTSSREIYSLLASPTMKQHEAMQRIQKQKGHPTPQAQQHQHQTQASYPHPQQSTHTAHGTSQPHVHIHPYTTSHSNENLPGHMGFGGLGNLNSGLSSNTNGLPQDTLSQNRYRYPFDGKTGGLTNRSAETPSIRTAADVTPSSSQVTYDVLAGLRPPPTWGHAEEPTATVQLDVHQHHRTFYQRIYDAPTSISGSSRPSFSLGVEDTNENATTTTIDTPLSNISSTGQLGQMGPQTYASRLMRRMIGEADSRTPKYDLDENSPLYTGVPLRNDEPLRSQGTGLTGMLPTRMWEDRSPGLAGEDGYQSSLASRTHESAGLHPTPIRSAQSFTPSHGGELDLPHLGLLSQRSDRPAQPHRLTSSVLSVAEETPSEFKASPMLSALGDSFLGSDRQGTVQEQLQLIQRLRGIQGEQPVIAPRREMNSSVPSTSLQTPTSSSYFSGLEQQQQLQFQQHQLQQLHEQRQLRQLQQQQEEHRVQDQDGSVEGGGTSGALTAEAQSFIRKTTLPHTLQRMAPPGLMLDSPFSSPWSPPLAPPLPPTVQPSLPPHHRPSISMSSFGPVTSERIGSGVFTNSGEREQLTLSECTRGSNLSALSTASFASMGPPPYHFGDSSLHSGQSIISDQVTERGAETTESRSGYLTSRSVATGNHPMSHSVAALNRGLQSGLSGEDAFGLYLSRDADSQGESGLHEHAEQGSEWSRATRLTTGDGTGEVSGLAAELDMLRIRQFQQREGGDLNVPSSGPRAIARPDGEGLRTPMFKAARTMSPHEELHEFFMFRYRTQACPLFGQQKCIYSRPYSCLQAHNPVHLRRVPIARLVDPKTGEPDPEGRVVWSYSATPCTFSASLLTCPRKANCPYAHKLQKETVFHPTIYKTQRCDSIATSPCPTCSRPFVQQTMSPPAARATPSQSPTAHAREDGEVAANEWELYSDANRIPGLDGIFPKVKPSGCVAYGWTCTKAHCACELRKPQYSASPAFTALTPQRQVASSPIASEYTAESFSGHAETTFELWRRGSAEANGMASSQFQLFQQQRFIHSPPYRSGGQEMVGHIDDATRRLTFEGSASPSMNAAFLGEQFEKQLHATSKFSGLPPPTDLTTPAAPGRFVPASPGELIGKSPKVAGEARIAGLERSAGRYGLISKTQSSPTTSMSHTREARLNLENRNESPFRMLPPRQMLFLFPLFQSTSHEGRSVSPALTPKPAVTAGEAIEGPQPASPSESDSDRMQVANMLINHDFLQLDYLGPTVSRFVEPLAFTALANHLKASTSLYATQVKTLYLEWLASLSSLIDRASLVTDGTSDSDAIAIDGYSIPVGLAALLGESTGLAESEEVARLMEAQGDEPLPPAAKGREKLYFSFVAPAKERRVEHAFFMYNYKVFPCQGAPTATSCNEAQTPWRVIQRSKSPIALPERPIAISSSSSSSSSPTLAPVSEDDHLTLERQHSLHPKHCSCDGLGWHRLDERRRGPFIAYEAMCCPSIKPSGQSSWGNPNRGCPTASAIMAMTELSIMSPQPSQPSVTLTAAASPMRESHDGKSQHQTSCARWTRCHRAHTLMELMYHVAVYKTALCSNFNEDDPSSWTCPWRRRCAHAHGVADLRAKADAHREWQLHKAIISALAREVQHFRQRSHQPDTEVKKHQDNSHVEEQKQRDVRRQADESENGKQPASDDSAEATKEHLESPRGASSSQAKGNGESKTGKTNLPRDHHIETKDPSIVKYLHELEAELCTANDLLVCKHKSSTGGCCAANWDGTQQHQTLSTPLHTLSSPSGDTNNPVSSKSKAGQSARRGRTVESSPTISSTKATRSHPTP